MQLIPSIRAVLERRLRKASGQPGFSALSSVSEFDLGNNDPLLGRKADDSGNVALIKLNASDQVELPNGFVIAAGMVAALSAGGFTMANIARTATAAGDDTGAIAAGPKLQFVAVTSDDVNKIITLPEPNPLDVVVLMNGATGYELRTTAPATIAINGGAGANAESAIPANTLVMLVCTSATTWVGSQWGTNGALTAVQVAAA